MVDIEVDNALDADMRIAEWKIKKLHAEIVRLRLKCGEHITMDEALRGFAVPDGGFTIKRSARYR